MAPSSGGCSHIIIDGQHFNRKDAKAQEMLAERERAQRVFTKEELIFGVEATKAARVEEEVGRKERKKVRQTEERKESRGRSKGRRRRRRRRSLRGRKRVKVT